MRWTRMAVVALLVSAVAALGAADSGHGTHGTRTVGVGSHTTISIAVTNPLPVTDTVDVTVNGPAVQDGTIDIRLPERVDGGSCDSGAYRCSLTLGPDETVTVPVTVAGERPGRTELVVSARSSTSDQASRASVQLRVPKRSPIASLTGWLGGLFS